MLRPVEPSSRATIGVSATPGRIGAGSVRCSPKTSVASSPRMPARRSAPRNAARGRCAGHLRFDPGSGRRDGAPLGTEGVDVPLVVSPSSWGCARKAARRGGLHGGIDSRRMVDGGEPGELVLYDRAEAGRLGPLDQFRAEVLERSFPPEQYQPGPSTPDELALVAASRDGVVAGGAIGDPYPGSLLLSYLAVRPGFRGVGVGSLLMDAILERWVTPDLLVLAEIDDPRHHPSHPQYGDPDARLRFYSRFGLRAVAMPYMQPRLAPELPRVEHMILSVISAPERCQNGAGVRGSCVEEFLREYYVDCEGPAALDDSEVMWLLGWCATDELPLVSLDELSLLPDLGPPSPASAPDPGGATERQDR
jgi:GNAT superfamily N-acetyltransferase